MLLASGSSSTTAKMIKLSKHVNLQSESRIRTLKSSRAETPRSQVEASTVQKRAPHTKTVAAAKKYDAKHKRSVSDTEKSMIFKQNLLSKFMLPQ